MEASSPILILGSGLAGYTLARELRKLDRNVSITVITADHGGFYSKPMLSNGFASGRSPESLVTSTAEAMATQLGIAVMAHTRVIAIDPAAKRVQTDQGVFDYGRLVLALGADPIRLPMAGDAADSVRSVNDWDDYVHFRQHLAQSAKAHADSDDAASERSPRVLIIGAGLIGCEFANDLRLGGMQVTLVDMADRPLGRLLPEQAASVLKSALAAAGVSWQLQTQVTRIDHGDGSLRVGLSNGASIAADVVLSAVGLKPRTALANAAGLAVGRGISVDAWLRSGDPSIFALGDCAEVCGLVLPYVMPIMQSARALAKTLLGEPTAVAYPAMPVTVKTPAAPTVVAPPMAESRGHWQEVVNEQGVVARYVADDGQLLGFALVGPATAERAALAKLLPAWL